MSMKDLYKAFELVENNFENEEKVFSGPQSHALIKKAEAALHTSFPKTYKIFLEKYGCGGVGSLEIYGLIKDEEFEEEKIFSSGIPNAVWTTLKYQKEYGYPTHLITIASLGNGDEYCIDTQQVDGNGENPIVVYPILKPESGQKLEIVAEDFGKFFLDMVQNQISYKNS
jgi:hypothetical protein